MQWISRSAALALVTLVAAPAAALADGGPVPPSQGIAIGVPGTSPTYGVFGAGRATIVKRLGAGGVPSGAQLRLRGQYGIPGVDYRGATTGLSADGHTLVLAQLTLRGAPRTTRLLVLRTPRLAIRARIALPGWSAVDAISPNGRWLYLIHYHNADISKYEVLAYNLLTHRMLPKPIVDPDDRGEAMTGFPITRVMSPGYRWAYTLYMRPTGAPFIHALDTVGHRAVCIDLPSLTHLDITNGHLSLGSGGKLLKVGFAGATRAAINTRTLTLVADTAGTSRSASAPAQTRPAAHKTAPRATGGVPWGLLAGLLAVLAAIAVGVARRQRPKAGPPIRVP